jgi:hypothetical protein
MFAAQNEQYLAALFPEPESVSANGNGQGGEEDVDGGSVSDFDSD